MMRFCIPLVLLTVVACGSDTRSVAGPNDGASLGTNPSTPSSGTTVLNVNWIGDATVESASDLGGCGWGRMAGETREGVLWRVAISGTTVTLEEDMSNWPTDHIPFAGTLNGQQFTAEYTQRPAGPCLFAGGTLIGTFADDFSTFTAIEVLHWGEGPTRTTVQRQWQVRKR
jgi:hypothetical protein